MPQRRAYSTFGILVALGLMSAVCTSAQDAQRGASNSSAPQQRRDSEAPISLGERPNALDISRKHSLKAGLAEYIRTAPDVLQFAKDRKYEKAWIIRSSEARPSTEAIKGYLAREKFDVLIVEYLWNSEDDDNRFVLTLYQDKRVKLRDPEQFIRTSVDLFYGKLPFATLMNELDTKVIGKTYLLQEPADAVSLGIFNYWVSTGPIDVWKAGEDLSETTVRDRITARPDIERTRLNFQALFFRFNVDEEYDGPYYGFKTPCCKKDGDFWIVDFPKTFRWMKFMLSEEHSNASQ